MDNMYNHKDKGEGPGPTSVLIAIIAAISTVVAALSGTFFASTHMPNLPTTTSTPAIALSPFKTFIPLTDTPTPPTPDSPTPSDPRMQIIEKQYTVVTGDTFEKISDKFFISKMYAEAIRKSNCVNVLSAGTELTIKYYVIQGGDDVFDIADRFKINVGRLDYINAKQNQLVIHPGQFLILPVSNICS